MTSSATRTMMRVSGPSRGRCGRIGPQGACTYQKGSDEEQSGCWAAPVKAPVPRPCSGRVSTLDSTCRRCVAAIASKCAEGVSYSIRTRSSTCGAEEGRWWVLGAGGRCPGGGEECEDEASSCQCQATYAASMPACARATTRARNHDARGDAGTVQFARRRRPGCFRLGYLMGAYTVTGSCRRAPRDACNTGAGTARAPQAVVAHSTRYGGRRRRIRAGRAEKDSPGAQHCLSLLAQAREGRNWSQTAERILLAAAANGAAHYECMPQQAQHLARWPVALLLKVGERSCFLYRHVRSQ